MRGVYCVAIDLPGFGDAFGTAGYDVSSMVHSVVEVIRTLRASLDPSGARPWVVAGHSMGGKVAAVVARRSLNGDVGLGNLRGLILVSPSPPGPEPIPANKRTEMMDSLGQPGNDPEQDRAHASGFVDDNTGKLPLEPATRELAVQGVLAMNRTAFRRWLTEGSEEDWAARVSTLHLPALVFAGSEDQALGPDAQREHTIPHLGQAQLVLLEGCGHLAPLERAGELIEHITHFLVGLDLTLSCRPLRPGSTFECLLQSDRVSPQTREVMTRRLATAQDWNATPRIFSVKEFYTLRALADRVVPGAGFDLASLVDAQLAEDSGDGWRLATLPSDTEAWHRGLRSLDLSAQRTHGADFLALHPGQQDDLLHRAADGKLGRGLLGAAHLTESIHAFNADDMKSWFEDARAAMARLYIADPRTMERIGFTGFADDLGFTQIELDRQEEFEH